MHVFINITNRLATYLAALAAIILVMMVALIMVEIVLRSFFDTSTFLTDEYVGYGVAAVTYLSLAHAFEKKALIRIGLLLDLTHGATRKALEYFSLLATLGVTLFLTYYIFRAISRNWNREAVSYHVSETPLWIPETLIFAGLLLFCIQLFSYFLRLLVGENPHLHPGQQSEHKVGDI